MPTLAELQDKVSRDLRDPTRKVFTDEYLTDLINAGLEEVGRIYPSEVIVTIGVLDDTYQYDMQTASSIYRVEVFRDDTFESVVAEGDGENSQSGWDLWAGSLRVPKGVVDTLTPGTHWFHVWGYQRYPQLVLDTDNVGLDDSAEWGVRRYARASAFTIMHSDRALFRQWQGASQNSDVTVNQLNQMVGFYTSEWDRTRNYLRRLRRA